MKLCEWVYRPGANNSHWAFTPCKKGFNYLSKIKHGEPYVGVADFYNGRLCPICNGTIKMNYNLLNTD